MQVDIFELKYTFPIYIQGYVCEGSGRATKSDEFSEKVPKGGGGWSFSIQKLQGYLKPVYLLYYRLKSIYDTV